VSEDARDDEAADIAIDARRFAGVWANAIRVKGDPEEVTMDFVRLDPWQPRGMVVARVTCSPQSLRRFMDELERVWHDWMWGSSPPETREP
jgi:Protein of unknown function (DUF3467)